MVFHAREEVPSELDYTNKQSDSDTRTEQNIPVLLSRFPLHPHTPQIWPVTPLTNTDYPKINFNKEGNPLSTTRDWERATRNTC